VVPRVRRRAVRDLHAGDGAGGVRTAVAESQSDGRGHPRRARRQPVPLHRLHAHLRLGAPRLPRGGRPGMIPLLDRFQLATPVSPAAALDDLAQHPGARPFAGGTDLMVVLEAGHLPPGRYVSLQHCRELVGIQTTSAGIAIGALTTYTGIRDSTMLAGYPMLAAAARETGGLATQNRGTIGGNIANASPAADTPPALLVYDAELELISATGTRRVPYATFHTAYKQTMLAPGGIISHIRLPRRTGGRDYYRKVGARR